MLEIIPPKVEQALFYFHSAGTGSREIAPYIEEIASLMPNAYLWAGDGNISGSALMSGHPVYGGPDERFWFVFPMEDACSEESFRKNRQAMGASLLSAGSFVNSLVDTVKERFGLSADKIVLSGFQHGAALALSSALMRKYDPFRNVLLFEPYLLEAYYLDDFAPAEDTVVICVDNEHIRDRTFRWIGIYTNEEFSNRGLNTKRVTVKGGDDSLSPDMIRAGIMAVAEDQ